MRIEAASGALQRAQGAAEEDQIKDLASSISSIAEEDRIKDLSRAIFRAGGGTPVRLVLLAQGLGRVLRLSRCRTFQNIRDKRLLMPFCHCFSLEILPVERNNLPV